MLSWRSLALYRTHTARIQPKKGDRVVVAMSGGVDSSVVAKLLADQDYDLSAVYMRNWDTRDESGTDNGCEWKKDWADVQRVCKVLDLPCELVDLSREYWTRVFEPALKTWEAGNTPNPDIWCNKEVKFGALADRVAPEGAWLATGHYARKAWSASPSLISHLLSSHPHPPSPRPKLLRPVDRHKDQTYYLSSIPEKSLARALFPLADLPKSVVREKAREWKLPTATRGESMGICFVGEKKKFDQFISQYVPPNPGPIIDASTGHTVGMHHGLWTYTIGQGARIKGMAEKMFVSRKEPSTNEIYVVPGSDHPMLYSKSISVKEWRWIWADSPPVGIDSGHGFRARMQFRHRMLDVPCTVYRVSDQGMSIMFDEPQKAVAAGQVATVWDGDWCLGCGVIEGESG